MNANASTVNQNQLGWYARFWRWHFFAALLVIPFVLWQSVTGILYIWHQEYEKAVHQDLMYVVPQSERVSYQSQLDVVLKQQAGHKVSQMIISAAPNKATQVFFTAANGLTYPAFVNPYTGAYLGDIAPSRWLAGITRSLHGGWPLGDYGSYLLELGDGWAMVMVLTGLYLWWPRNNTLGGVLYPRLSQGKRVFWRDLHAVVAIYISGIVLVFLITALPWTTFWGNNVLRPIEQVFHQRSPSQEFFRGGVQGVHASHHTSVANAQIEGEHASLDKLVSEVKSHGASGDLYIRFSSKDSIVNVRDDHPHAQDNLYFKLDAVTGSLVSQANWSDFSLIPKLVALGVDLHQGTLFGLANQIVNTIMALGLIWLSVSGFVLWYQRRPSATGVSAPPRRQMRWTLGLKINVVSLCVVLPLLGMSVLLISGLDQLFGRRLAA